MRNPPQHREGEEGYLLLGLVVVCFLLLLVLSVAGPRVAKELERDREVEATHRAEEYVRAIQLYYRKNNAFPNSIDQLVGTSGLGTVSSALNVRYLRQRYKDPLTNDEFRLIHAGEAQTEVKGFFGEPLQGLAQNNLGAAAGMVSNLGGSGATSAAGAAGSAPGAGAGFSLGSTSSTAGASTTGTPAAGSGTSATGTGTSSTGTSATGAGTSGTGTGTGTGPSSTDATTFQGSKGAIVGVGSNAKGAAIVAWNGSDDISQWEFLYDPRVELLKANVSIFGGSPAASGTGSLGSGFAPISGATGQPGQTGTGIGTGIGGMGTSTTGGATTTSPSTGTGTSTSPIQ